MNIPSTAVKQARGGWGLHEKDTFRRGDYGGKLYFLRWVGEQPDKFRLFLYGGNLHFFCRLFDPLDCVRIVQNCCKLCTFLQQVVFIWHGSFFFMLYFKGNDRRIQCNRIALNKN